MDTRTPDQRLLDAVQANHYNDAFLALNDGANPCLRIINRNKQQYYPLVYTVQTLELAALLIDYGANPNEAGTLYKDKILSLEYLKSGLKFDHDPEYGLVIGLAVALTPLMVLGTAYDAASDTFSRKSYEDQLWLTEVTLSYCFAAFRPCPLSSTTINMKIIKILMEMSSFHLKDNQKELSNLKLLIRASANLNELIPAAFLNKVDNEKLKKIMPIIDYKFNPEISPFSCVIKDPDMGKLLIENNYGLWSDINSKKIDLTRFLYKKEIIQFNKMFNEIELTKTFRACMFLLSGFRDQDSTLSIFVPEIIQLISSFLIHADNYLDEYIKETVMLKDMKNNFVKTYAIFRGNDFWNKHRFPEDNSANTPQEFFNNAYKKGAEVPEGLTARTLSLVIRNRDNYSSSNKQLVSSIVKYKISLFHAEASEEAKKALKKEIKAEVRASLK